MKIAKRALEITPSLTLELTAKAKKLKKEGRDVVSFGAGEPDFNTPEYIRNAAKEALDKGLTKYTPASGTATLKKVICDKLKRDNGLDYSPANIVVSNGAKHALFNANNPNNPTGAVYTEEEIVSLARVVEKTDIAVISDEIYEVLNYTDKPVYSIAAYSQKLKDQTIIVNGVSKTYSMTGWRIGFTACDAAVSKAISSMQSHATSNPNTIAQYAAQSAYEHEEGEAFLREMRESFDRRRKLIMAKLDEIPLLSYVRPDGAFYIFVSVEKVLGKSYDGVKINSALDFANILLDKKDVTVIPCESFGADGYIRLSYAISDEDIVKGVERIGEFIAHTN